MGEDRSRMSSARGGRHAFASLKLTLRCRSNPLQWPDGTYSVQGAATALGITPQVIFDYLARGWLKGHQLTKGQPWQIELSDSQISALRERIARNRRSRKEAL
jgi:hypothetical protein